MGWFSNLFQQTVEIEFTDDQGRKQQKNVSKREFDALMNKAVAEGKATIHEGCEVHILDPVRGSRVENWIVGEQVKRDTYDKFKDRNGHLFVVIAYEKGEPNGRFVAKQMWDQVATQFANIESEASASFNMLKRDLGGL